MIVEQLSLIILFAAISLSMLWLCKIWGVYEFNTVESQLTPPSTLAALFATLCFLFTFLLPVFFYLSLLHLFADKKALTGASQCLTLLTAIILYFVILRNSAPKLLSQLFRVDHLRKHLRDGLFLAGLFIFSTLWIHGGLILLLKVFDIEYTDQSAILFLKSIRSSPVGLILGILTVTILAPIAEELFFRGIFYNYLRARFSVRISLITSALVFSLVHYTPSQGLGNIALILPIFVGGIILAFSVERSRSLIPAIVAHSLFNSFSMVILLTIEA